MRGLNPPPAKFTRGLATGSTVERKSRQEHMLNLNVLVHFEISFVFR